MKKRGNEQKDFTAALCRVGSSTQKNAAYFLDMTRSPWDQGEVHTEEREKRWDDLLCLALLARWGEAHGKLTKEETHEWMRSERLLWDHPDPDCDEHLEEKIFYQSWWRGVRRIKVTLLQILNTVIANKSIKVFLPEMPCEISRDGWRGTFPLDDLFIERSGKDLASQWLSVEGGVLLRLGQVLAVHGQSLRQCQGCPPTSADFFARRQDQRFCSRSCQDKVKMRRKRKREKTKHV